ncbi:MAG: hypothetical protein FJ040_02820 [Chloroflexi bacterium]|nr:hypothetical protein [Chloroflexota bacterium]
MKPAKRLSPWHVIMGVIATAVMMRIGIKVVADRERNRPTAMVDWPAALQLAQRMLPEAHQPPVHNYQSLVDAAGVDVGAFTGLHVPPDALRVRVVDQHAWLTANVRSFARLMAPLEPLWLAQHDHSDWGLASRRMNGRVAGIQSGAMLSWMATRVLGQYDTALLHDDDAPNELLLVEANIARIATEQGVNVADLRQWIVIHEVSHVFQFEGIPWLRPHLRMLLDRFMRTLADQLVTPQDGFLDMVRRMAQQPKAQSWVEWALNPEQRTIFNEMQVLMSLIEGHSNYVMNRIGAHRIAQFGVLQQRMEARQQERPTLDVVIMRVTGMQMKMAQYRDGEAFVNALAAHGGDELVRRLWQTPRHLPTVDELAHPATWIARYGESVDARAP